MLRKEGSLGGVNACSWEEGGEGAVSLNARVGEEQGEIGKGKGGSEA